MMSSNDSAWRGAPDFVHRGFYLHAAWAYNYPFAVRMWNHSDYTAMFDFLGHLHMDRVMLWPPFELIPSPLSPDDKAALEQQRRVVADAQDRGLSCWVVITANMTCRATANRRPVNQRHVFSDDHLVCLNDRSAREQYLRHREDMIAVLNNADAYVTIDGDPGSYPHATPEALLDVLDNDRNILNRVGAHADRQTIISWLWNGWGRPIGDKFWAEPVGPYTRAVTASLATRKLAEPWAILAGRSHRDDFANGRVNVQAVIDSGLMNRTTIMFYEGVEFEPTPPAVVVQFDLIRHMLRREAGRVTDAQGAMCNAQQPICALHNLYFFARASWSLDYLDCDDQQVLSDFADFLGGPADQLVPAWRCLDIGFNELDSSLPEKLSRAKLTSHVAACIPGGSDFYLQMLAGFVHARLAILRLVAMDRLAAQPLAEAIAAGVNWWAQHRYVKTGAEGEGFDWAFTHPRLITPLRDWIRKRAPLHDPVRTQCAEHLVELTGLAFDEATAAIDRL